MSKTFNATDYVLQTISYWPDIGTTEYFQSRLKFQVFQFIWKSNLFDRNSEGVAVFFQFIMNFKKKNVFSQ